MNFEDAVIARIAHDPSGPRSLFDQASLAQLVGAAFDADALGVEGPYDAVFDEVTFGFPVAPRVRVDGASMLAGTAQRSEGAWSISGLSIVPRVRVDLLWRGALVARTVPAGSVIESVSLSWVEPTGIDDEIVQALGALPSDPQQLEAERRARYLGRVRATMAQPLAFKDEHLDRWLRGVGARSVGDFMARYQGHVKPAPMRLVMSAPAGAGTVAVPRMLPVVAALLVRGTGFSLAELLSDSKVVRRQLVELGVEQPPDRSLPAREGPLVIWVLPESVFDDAGWPGGESASTDTERRLQRRLALGAWLAREGMGVVTAVGS